MSASKEIFNTYVATVQHLTGFDLIHARLQIASNLIQLKIPTAMFVVNFFVSEADCIKVPVYLNINRTATCVGSVIARFRNDSISLSFSNRLIEALYDGNDASELNQLDVDLAMAEENLRNTIVAASSDDGKKLCATEKDVVQNIHVKNRSMGYLCWNIFNFLKENNPFQREFPINNSLKQSHCEQLETLKKILINSKTSQAKDGVQKLEQLSKAINPWAKLGRFLRTLGVVAVFFGFIAMIFFIKSDSSVTPSSLGLMNALTWGIGPILTFIGHTLSREKFELPPAVLNADKMVNSRLEMIAEEELVCIPIPEVSDDQTVDYLHPPIIYNHVFAPASVSAQMLPTINKQEIACYKF